MDGKLLNCFGLGYCWLLLGFILLGFRFGFDLLLGFCWWCLSGFCSGGSFWLVL